MTLMLVLFRWVWRWLVDIDVDDGVEVYDDDEVAVEEGCSLLDACIFVLATFVQNPFIPLSCS